jgi:uncharacterized membrane protein
VAAATALLVVSVALASAVEAVEALTIVMALGVSRGWRGTLQGVGAGVAVLAAVVAALGPALTLIPVGALRLVVGAVLVVFGLQWLRKAILRASGFKPRHDETAIYQRQVQDARKARSGGRAALASGLISDGYAFTLSFKAVVLEGLEVAIIVITFGASQGSVGLAALGAVLAILAVTAAGIVVRAPLARVPENTMAFAVGVLLTSFGTYWAAQGVNVRWPAEEVALLAIIAYLLVMALAAVAVLRRLHRRWAGSAASPAAAGPERAG